MRSTPSRATCPTALLAKDYHSLWLNSAALAHANGDLAMPGGVVELDERRRADGRPPRGVGVAVQGALRRDRDEEYLDALRAGLRLAASRGVTAVHDKDGWLPAIPRLWQMLEGQGQLSLRVWQSLPHDRLDRLADLGLAAGIGDERLRLGYLKVFMDGTLGSQTALMLDGSGVEITSREELADIVRRGARVGWPVAVHAIGDLANRNALDAFEETRTEWEPLGLRHRIEHAQCLAQEDVPRFAELGVAASVQFSTRPPMRRWPSATGPAVSTAPMPSGASGTRARSSPTAPTPRSRSSTPGPGSVPASSGDWHPEQAVTVEQAIEATTVNPAG